MSRLFVLIPIALLLCSCARAGSCDWDCDYGDKPCEKKPIKKCWDDGHDWYAPSIECESEMCNRAANSRRMKKTANDFDCEDFAKDFDKCADKSTDYEKCIDCESDEGRKTHAASEKNTDFHELKQHKLKDHSSSAASSKAAAANKRKAMEAKKAMDLKKAAEKSKRIARNEAAKKAALRDRERGMLYKKEDEDCRVTVVPDECPCDGYPTYPYGKKPKCPSFDCDEY